MFQAKETVLDRIEQTFGVFIKNPVALILPLVMFQIVMIELIPQVGISVLFASNFSETMSVTSLIYSAMSLAIVYGLFYVILIIPVTLGIIKGASELTKGNNINSKQLVTYGFQKISDAFKVYWYMFAYAYLVPAICIIISGFMLLYGLFAQQEILISAGGFLMGISFFYAFIQGAYRGLKSSFSIGGAIHEDDFSREQFALGISITKNKWWRILGNFMLVSLIAGLLIGLVSGLLSSISFVASDTSDIFNITETSSPNLKNILGDIGGFSFLTFILNSITQLLSGIVTVFLVIFSLIFYIRLKDESSIDTQTQKKAPQGEAPMHMNEL